MSRAIINAAISVVALLLISIEAPNVAIAGEVGADVRARGGKAVPDVVMLLLSQDNAVAVPAIPPGEPTRNEIVQQSLQFTPYILPVRRGASVNFPNKDDVRHHVYSFSKPKRFELKLYSGDEDRSVTFDETGIVALGCNIHDNMIAYVVVTDAPHFGISDSAGRITLKGVTPGNYKARFWHPDLRNSKTPVETQVTVSEAGTQEIDMVLDIKTRAKTSVSKSISSSKRDEVEY